MSLFHRRANPKTQTIKTAVAQNRSGELWGRGAFGGLPSALAYVGPLAGVTEGTEFTCSVPYARNGHPEWAYWYLPQHGGDQQVVERVSGDEAFACVPIVPVRNRYGCR